jgi:hypothetical protein
MKVGRSPADLAGERRLGHRRLSMRPNLRIPLLGPNSSKRYLQKILESGLDAR